MKIAVYKPSGVDPEDEYEYDDRYITLEEYYAGMALIGTTMAACITAPPGDCNEYSKSVGTALAEIMTAIYESRV